MPYYLYRNLTMDTETLCETESLTIVFELFTKPLAHHTVLKVKVSVKADNELKYTIVRGNQEYEYLHKIIIKELELYKL